MLFCFFGFVRKTGKDRFAEDTDWETKPGTDGTFLNIADAAQAIFEEETGRRPVCPEFSCRV